MWKAVFFDLDDTLMSFEGATKKAWTKICKEFVAKHQTKFDWQTMYDSINEVKEWYWDDPVRHKIGRENMQKARREVLMHAMLKLNFTEVEQIEQTADSYTSLQEEYWELFDGVTEALTLLQRKGIRMAVITNGTSQTQRKKLDRFGLTEFFDEIVIDTEVGVSKPDPAIFQYALDRMQLMPEEVLMIGDHLIWDVYGPKQLSIFSVWNDYEGVGLEKDSKVLPDAVVTSVAELVKRFFT